MRQLLVVAILACLAPLAQGQSYVNRWTYTAHMEGYNQLPPVESPGSAWVVFWIQSGDNQVHYRVDVRHLQDVTGVTLNYGGPTEIGAVVASLYSGIKSGPVDGVLAEGAIRPGDLGGPLSGASLDAMLKEFSVLHLYVSLQTAANPDGELRGQVQ